MPGFVLNVGATVLCAHGGQAQPVTPFPRVLVNGTPIATVTTQYVIAGCPFVPPAGNGPCVTAQWVIGAVRVFAGGSPVLVQTGQAICVPTATPLIPVVVQPRVAAS
jgi:hypothetical protein